MNAVTGQFIALWEQAVTIWLSGGWGMIALAVNALVMLVLGMHVLFKLREKGYQSVPEKTWRRWIDHPTERRGPIGKLLDFVTGAHSLKQMTVFFEDGRYYIDSPWYDHTDDQLVQLLERLEVEVPEELAGAKHGVACNCQVCRKTNHGE